MVNIRFSASARVASLLLAVGAVSVAAVAACGDSSGTGTGGATTSSGTPTTTTSSTPTTTTGAMTTGTMSSSASSSTGGPPGGFDCTAATGTVPGLKLTNLTANASLAVLAIAAPDDPDRIYVVELNGKIEIIENGTLLPTPFIDIGNLVNNDGGEQGLLGLAFHPQYATNGRFFVHYSKKSNGDNVVQEFKRSAADPHIADPTPVQLALEHTTAQENHNGGSLGFGQDGFLYLSMGDGGNQGDPECDAQLDSGGDPAITGTNLLGKISRLDVNGTPDASGYPAAAGNPNGLKSYHHGFRNPWRMSFDGCTGDLFVGDVGQNTYEEVDQITIADGPVNCGWPYREGTHAFNTPGTCPANPGGLHEPITDYDHGQGNAVVGGYMYRSSAIPALRGAYFYGDNGSGKVWYIFPGSAPVLTTLAPGNGVLGGMGQDGHGNVYLACLDGNIYRIDAM